MSVRSDRSITPDHIRARARDEGFASCGITAAHNAIPARNQARLTQFMALGQHGTMDWMERRIDERAAPTALWDQARAVISLGYNYGPNQDPMDRVGVADLANISAYAWGRDYHDMVKKSAKRLARWLAQETGSDVKVFVDTAPVLEKPLAQQAGLGWQGKHTNLVSAAHGSWLFLAEIYTAFDLPPDPPGRDQCGSCTRCLDICPTRALPAPYTLDATLCLAYLSIEHEGPIPVEFRAAMGNRIYGCDDCLAVCPWNKFASQSHQTKFHQPEIANLNLVDALHMDDDVFRAFFTGSPVKRIKWHRWMRNALIVAGNTDPATWRAVQARVQMLTTHPDPTLREAAVWAQTRHESVLR